MRHSGEACTISRNRAEVYELARLRHPRLGAVLLAVGVSRRWSGINSPAPRKHPQIRYVGKGRLMVGRGVIFLVATEA